MADQSPRRNQPKDTTRQGIYAATADGRLLSFKNGQQPETMLPMMREGLDKFASASSAHVGALPAAEDGRYSRHAPEGGLVLNVFSRILGIKGGSTEWNPNVATGRDHIWITREEMAQLAPREWRKGASFAMPESVARRLCRYHLVDNVRGEPVAWRPEELSSCRVTLTVADPAKGFIELSGRATMTHGIERGYDARLFGEIVIDRSQSRLTRLDILAAGNAFGEGPYTRGAPPGTFLLAIAFQICQDPPSAQAPPQGSRDLTDYMGNRGR